MDMLGNIALIVVCVLGIIGMIAGVIMIVHLTIDIIRDDIEARRRL